MKKILIIITTGIVGIALLPKFIEALAAFLLAGQLPGADLSISPTVIYITSILTGCGLVAHLIISAVERLSLRRMSTAHSPRKVALPANRYHRLHS